MNTPPDARQRALGWAPAALATALILLPSCTRDAARPLEPRGDPSAEQSRDGADLLGQPIRSEWIEHFAGSPLRFTAQRATLVRWWTDTCPFCEASLPAVEQLRQTYGPRGLATLAVYHPKPPHPLDDPEGPRAAVSAAEERGYRGPVALDPTWNALRRIWLDTGERDATSVCFLLDGDGLIRFVHPGPEFHPGGQPGHEDCAADFAELERAIQALLPAD